MNWQRKILFLMLFVPILLIGILFSYFELRQTTVNKEQEQVQQYQPQTEYSQPTQEYQDPYEEQEEEEYYDEEEEVYPPEYSETLPKKKDFIPEDEDAIRFEYDMENHVPGRPPVHPPSSRGLNLQEIPSSELPRY